MQSRLFRQLDGRSRALQRSHQAELASFLTDSWTGIIMENAGGQAPPGHIGCGTGPGFFAIMMTLAGNRFRAIASTAAMIGGAAVNAAEAVVSVEFSLSRSDSRFPDASFKFMLVEEKEAAAA